jgi:hypothetical protein
MPAWNGNKQAEGFALSGEEPDGAGGALSSECRIGIGCFSGVRQLTMPLAGSMTRIDVYLES